MLDLRRVLALDLSTKTGWSVGESSDQGYRMVAHGQVPKVACPAGQYPDNFLEWSALCFGPVSDLLDEWAPDVLVVEDTAIKPDSNALSQKILEFIHFRVAKMVAETGIERLYLMTDEWRRLVGCEMTKAERKQNQVVSKAKGKARALLPKGDKSVVVVKGEDGRRIGRVTRKHVNVRRANEAFGLGLKIKDNDVADALMLGLAYHEKRKREAQ